MRAIKGQGRAIVEDQPIAAAGSGHRPRRRKQKMIGVWRRGLTRAVGSKVVRQYQIVRAKVHAARLRPRQQRR